MKEMTCSHLKTKRVDLHSELCYHKGNNTPIEVINETRRIHLLLLAFQT